MNNETPLQIPAADVVKDLQRLRCSACEAIAPFTIREFEDSE